MTNGTKCFLAFSAGAAIGVVVSWKFLKTKYEQLAQKEIDDVQEYYREYYQDKSTKRVKEPEPDPEIPEKVMIDYKEIANEYSAESTSAKIEDDDGPYVITPEELGDIDEYDTTTLYYYEDGVLVTLDDTVVEDVAGTVGEDFASHFGEYEDDSVCVRNPAHKCDYEILRDLRRYSEVKQPIRPHETEE